MSTPCAEPAPWEEIEHDLRQLDRLSREHPRGVLLCRCNNCNALSPARPFAEPTVFGLCIWCKSYDCEIESIDLGHQEDV